MTELLHLSALLPAAFGVCCTVGGRRGRPGFDAVAALVMLVAMADVALGLALVAPILWVAALVLLALASTPLARHPAPLAGAKRSQGLRGGSSASVAALPQASGGVATLLQASGGVTTLPQASGGLATAPLAGAKRSQGVRGGFSASVASLLRASGGGAPLPQASGGVAALIPASGGGRPVALAGQSICDRSRGPAHAPTLHTSLGLIVMAGLVALMSAGHAASASGHHGGGGLLPMLVLGGSATYVGYSAWRAGALFRMPSRNLLGCLEASSMAASVALMAGALAL